MVSHDIRELAFRAKKCLRAVMVNTPGWQGDPFQKIHVGAVEIKRDMGVWSITVELTPGDLHLIYCETPSGDPVEPPSGDWRDPKAVEKALLTLRQHMILDDLSAI